jgi:hypothetical protein
VGALRLLAISFTMISTLGAVNVDAKPRRSFLITGNLYSRFPGPADGRCLVKAISSAS